MLVIPRDVMLLEAPKIWLVRSQQNEKDWRASNLKAGRQAVETSDTKLRAMMTQIRNRFRQLRRGSLPPVDATTSKQYDAVMARFDQVMARFDGVDYNLAGISKTLSDLEFLLTIAPTQISNLLGELKHSKSQIRQDIFVLAELGLKRNGFFVEFGATNGIDLSNTLLLEKKYGWTGILAEPAKCWHAALRANRKARIETKCVWSKSNTILNFQEAEMAEFSTVHCLANADQHREIRRKSTTYEIKTISLIDMLEKYEAPKVIDYLSIDTEGSEYEILKEFDFEKYEIKVITCEHNFTEMREKLRNLFTSKGYTQKFEDLSLWDDWYVKM